MKLMVRERSKIPGGRLWLSSAGSDAWPRSGFPDVLLIPECSFAILLGLRKLEPRLGGVADAFQQVLQFSVLAVQGIAVGFACHLDRRADDEHDTREQMRNLKPIPGFLERMRAFRKQVMPDDGDTSAPRQQNNAGLGDPV